jgi:hypothetical protein
MKTSHGTRCRFKRHATTLLLGLWYAGCLSSYGIVDASSSANTNAPPDGSPWENVGNVNGASGTYLGAGWVLTAAHVGAGDLILDSGPFLYDGTSQRLTNSDGTPTDMVMFHLGALPNLPRLSLAASTPGAGSQVSMIAYGKIAGSTETNIGAYTGFYWSGNGYKSWGNNKVDAGGLTTANEGYGTVTLFSTLFNKPSHLTTSDPAQAAAGDSGGGVFEKTGGSWQLAGMLDLSSDYTDQPLGTAVYGNVTYCADIATYRGEIVAIIQSTIPTLSITQSGTDVQACWPDTGVAYNLQVTETLSPASWTLAGGNSSSAAGQLCVVLPATNSAGFFRLQRQ